MSKTLSVYVHTYAYLLLSLPCLKPNFKNSQTLRTALDFKTTVVRDGRAANLSSLERMKHPLWIQAINQQHRRENRKNSTTMLWLFDFPLKRRCVLWWVGNLYINQFLQKVWSSNTRQKKKDRKSREKAQIPRQSFRTGTWLLQESPNQLPREHGCGKR